MLLENSYDQGELTGQRFANGDTYTYRYQRSPNGTYVDTASVTSPDGSTQQIPTGAAVPDKVRRQR